MADVIQSGKLYRVTWSLYAGQEAEEHSKGAKSLFVPRTVYLLAISNEPKPWWVRKTGRGYWFLYSETKIWIDPKDFYSLAEKEKSNDKEKRKL